MNKEKIYRLNHSRKIWN